MMLASSALLIVCFSDFDLISIRMVRSSGNTTAPPRVGLPDIFEPSVYINLVLSLIGQWGCMMSGGLSLGGGRGGSMSARVYWWVQEMVVSSLLSWGG